MRSGLLARFRRVWAAIPRWALWGAAGLVVFLAVSFALVVAYYDRVVTRTMEGRRWSIPTRLYSDVWVLQPGDALGPDDVERRLARLRYAPVPAPPVTGGRYLLSRSRLVVGVNPRETAYGRFPGMLARIDFSGRRIAGLKRESDGSPLPYVVFEPEVVGSVFDQKMEDRTLVRLAQVPKVVLDAILTTEDRDFFTHAGLSPKRLVGAVLQSVARGRSVRGTSTLTQQLVKNLFLTPERTLRRKAVEALLAVILDAKYGKEEILEAYLNEIYLGQRGSVSVTGVEEAARFYFGKPVSQLDLPEAAMLAGLISSPGRFSPFRNTERAQARRALVLKGMLDEKKIDRAAYDAALAAPLTRVSKPVAGIEAPHFVDFVLTQVKESRSDLSGAGLSLYTTLDPDMQAAAQAAVLSGLEELEKKFKRLRTKEGTEPLQAALIALDPHTGSIRALVGGRDYQVSQFNRVVQARRQPGSLFKPFVYLAAFERRDLVPPVTPITILQDSPIALVFGKTEEETWSPRNYDGQFRGPVTVRYALEHSLNIPTVRLAVWETGGGKTLLSDVIVAARKAGITSPMKAYPSLALGAFECTPMEIAAAYSVFANGGILVKPNSLLGLVGPEGRRIDRKDVPLQRAADPAAVSVLDSILQGVVNRGTGASARGRGAQGIFAGKTGTTNDGRDAWFIGFSPRLLVAVWVGFDDNRGLNLSGSTAAVPIYADFARRLPSHFFEEPFPEVPGVVTASVDPTTGMLVTEDCPTSINEQFLSGTQPTERCTVHGGGSPAPAGGPGLPPVDGAEGPR
ncbi:MAG: PBP1A family penicillin-binding protein [Holophagales bacterium]|jgi:penicillin-binding protein 1B|nr:PBP1A family penicillin-binding protein [Holophagales bacterium]